MKARAPAAQHGADQPLCLAVGARGAGAGAQVLEAQFAVGGAPAPADVGGSVVGHACSTPMPCPAYQFAARRGKATACPPFGGQ